MPIKLTKYYLNSYTKGGISIITLVIVMSLLVLLCGTLLVLILTKNTPDISNPIPNNNTPSSFEQTIQKSILDFKPTSMF